MEKKARVHGKGHNHRRNMGTAPGQSHLGKKGGEGHEKNPYPVRAGRHHHMTHHKKGTAYHGIDLEIKNNFCPRVASFFCEPADTGIGRCGTEGRNHTQQGIPVERLEIPHLQHHGGAGGNGDEPGYHLPGGRGFKKNGRQNAHEKGGELHQDFRIPQLQPRQTVEEKKNAKAAEKAPEVKQEPVLSGKYGLSFMAGDKGNEKEPRHSADKGNFSHAQRGQYFGAHVHDGK